MRYYQEISLLHRANIGLYDFWQKLYQQIHLALAENKDEADKSAIGVSFPEYDAAEFLLGTKLRLFAEEESRLEQLQCEKWVIRLKDYVDCSQIKPVPEIVAGQACFRQIKPKGNKEKLARRQSKRRNIPLEQALAHFESYEEERSRLPYVNMVSLSSGQHFRIFIAQEIKESPQTGNFSCYGLSRTTTVPLF